MSDFGDVRSAAHAGDRDGLRLALADYDDNRVPHLEVGAYVKRLDATLWPVTWRGGNGASDDVLRAHKHESPTLSAYIMVGAHKIEALALDDAEASVQRAMTPIRREALDLRWMQWAQECDKEVREATRLLYACLDDPTLRRAAREAAWEAAWKSAWPKGRAAAWAAARAAARDMAWDAARAAAAVAAWDAAWASAMDAALAKINRRVGAAIIKEALP